MLLRSQIFSATGVCFFFTLSVCQGQVVQRRLLPLFISFFLCFPSRRRLKCTSHTSGERKNGEEKGQAVMNAPLNTVEEESEVGGGEGGLDETRGEIRADE